MNLLLAIPRQHSLYEDWVAIGVRQLLQHAFPQPLHWSLYNRNSDTEQPFARSLRKRGLFRSNSFHHQTLMPFQAIILAGSSVWTGGPMERLFSVLSKMEIPLLGMGLEIPPQPRSFEPLESLCFARSSVLLTAKNENTREWLRRFDLNSTLVTCPSLFAPPPAFLNRQRPERPPAITFCLEDSFAQGGPSEPLVRKIVRSIPKISSRFKTELVCTHMNDFMRFSTMFPGLVTYSYEVRDYFSIFDRTDLILTTSLPTAIIANSMEKPAIWITLEKYAGSDSQYPFVYPHLYNSQAALEEVIANMMRAPSLQPRIRDWKEQAKQHWLSLFIPYDANLRQAA